MVPTHCVEIPDITQSVTAVRRRWVACYFGTDVQCAEWVEQSHGGDPRISDRYRVRKLTKKDLAHAR